MAKEYLIAFSSYYKAMYAKDVLQERRINTSVQRLPPELVKSCGYALYINGGEIDLITKVLKNKEINIRGAYRIDNENGINKYNRVL